MLMCGSDNFVGNGMFALPHQQTCTDTNIPVWGYVASVIIMPASNHGFNIIDNEHACSDIVQFLNKNRFKFYNNVVVIVADSLVAKLCVELLYVEK